MLLTGMLWLLAVGLVIVGIAGLALPALPGAPLLFLGLVTAAWADNFAYVDTQLLVVLAILAALTYAVDIIAGALGARRFGASGWAIFGATAGALVGVFFGLAGIVLGPFLGALGAELLHSRNLTVAGKSGVGATLGMLAGALAKLAIAFSMLGLFAYARFSGAG
jgi:uncharacterized protein YqgC (DUF456 family)